MWQMVRRETKAGALYLETWKSSSDACDCYDVVLNGAEGISRLNVVTAAG